VLGPLISHRRYIVITAFNDLRSRFVGTALGWLWLALPPLALIAIYSVVLSSIMPMKDFTGMSTSTSFVIYLACGLLPWLVFAEGLARGTNIFLEATPYLKKLSISEEVFVARVAMVSLLMMLGSFALLAAIATVFGYLSPRISWLLTIPVSVMFCVLLFGVACILATLNIFIRDIGQAIALVLQVWMWLSPIVYVESIVPAGLQFIFWLNPAYPFIKALHEAFLDGVMPEARLWAAMLGWDALFILAGLSLLRALRSDLRDAL
jgi:lipopolysaccharide transport system permease protein